MEELEKSVEAQAEHVKQLQKEIDEADSKHQREMAAKKRLYAEAIIATQGHIDLEKDEVMTQLKVEYSREEALKMNEVRELGESIREKERQLTELGVNFDKTDINAGGALGTGQAQFTESRRGSQKGSAGKKKKGGDKSSKGCAQS